MLSIFFMFCLKSSEERRLEIRFGFVFISKQISGDLKLSVGIPATFAENITIEKKRIIFVLEER